MWEGLPYKERPIYNTAISRGNVRVLRSAFWHMIKLRKVKILSDKLTEIGRDAFAWCNELEEVNIPEGVTRIGDHAFWWSLCLRKVELPSTLTRIEDFAFDSDPLDSIDIPAGVTFIGRNAFWNNRELKKVYSRPVVPPTTSEWSDTKPYCRSTPVRRRLPSSMYRKARQRPTGLLRCSRSSRTSSSLRSGNGPPPSTGRLRRRHSSKCMVRLARSMSWPTAMAAMGRHRSMCLA